MSILISDSLAIPNKFPKSIEKDLEKYGTFSMGSFHFNSLKTSEFIQLCKNNAIDIEFTKEALKKIAENANVTIYYSNNFIKIKFNSRYGSPVIKKEEWIKFTEKTSQSSVLEYKLKYFYGYNLCIKLLEEEGNIVVIHPSLNWMHESIQYGEIQKIEKIGDWTPAEHQIDSKNRLIEKNGKGVIGDDAGLGKTISAGLILEHYFNQGILKRGIWIVPTIPLVYQVAEEMENRFNIKCKIITGKTSKKDRLLKEDGSVYQKNGFCIMTWATFTTDWTTNFDLVKKLKFDFAVFDEVHRSQMGNKTYDAILNFPAKIRIGLTGTPSPNGKYIELYNILYSIDPECVPPIDHYERIRQKLIDTYTKHPLPNELPEKTADKIVNKMANTELEKLLIRHKREILKDDLPQICETKIHTEISGNEERVMEILFNILSRTIENWRMDKYNKIIEFAKSMLWQDTRRYCSFGGKNLGYRIQAMLRDKKPVYEYIRKNFMNELREINTEFTKKTISDHPKFEILSDYLLNIDPSSHVLVFCDSVRTSIDLGIFLKKKGFETKVITGEININEMTDDIGGDISKEDEIKEIKKDFEYLDQSGRMNDDEVQDILSWFWNPFTELSELPELVEEYGVNVRYRINNKNWVTRVFSVTLAQANTIEFEIDVIKKMKWKDEQKFNRLLERIMNIDKDFKMNIENNKMHGIFKVNPPKRKRILIATNKLSMGCNLQIAQSVIFFDYPISIAQREQRIARIQRMGSKFKKIFLISIICGIEYAIERNLLQKYDNASSIGFVDPNPVSIYETIKIMKQILKTEKEKKSKKGLDSFI